MTPNDAVLLVSGFLLFLVSAAAVFERNPEFWDRIAEKVFR